MYLKPSKIRYCQDSIKSTFRDPPYRHIGETLDDILTGFCNVNSIPRISVVFKDGHWFTSDNRRLWVFQEAEKRGKCDEIEVRVTSYINPEKFSTYNNGTSVRVRGNPGGSIWQKTPIRTARQSAQRSTNQYRSVTVPQSQLQSSFAGQANASPVDSNQHKRDYGAHQNQKFDSFSSILKTGETNAVPSDSYKGYGGDYGAHQHKKIDSSSGISKTGQTNAVPTDLYKGYGGYYGAQQHQKIVSTSGISKTFQPNAVPSNSKLEKRGDSAAFRYKRLHSASSIPQTITQTTQNHNLPSRASTCNHEYSTNYTSGMHSSHARYTENVTDVRFQNAAPPMHIPRAAPSPHYSDDNSNRNNCCCVIL